MKDGPMINYACPLGQQNTFDAIPQYPTHREERKLGCDCINISKKLKTIFQMIAV